MEASLAYKTKKIVEKYGFSFKKNFGQNFLVDERVLGKIVSSAEISKDDVVIEVGPGIGTLTQALAKDSFSATAFPMPRPWYSGATTTPAMTSYSPSPPNAPWQRRGHPPRRSRHTGRRQARASSVLRNDFPTPQACARHGNPRSTIRFPGIPASIFSLSFSRVPPVRTEWDAAYPCRFRRCYPTGTKGGGSSLGPFTAYTARKISSRRTAASCSGSSSQTACRSYGP